MRPLVIFGCGYTGKRVALRWLAEGGEVIATTRRPESLHLKGARIVAMDASNRLSLSKLHEVVPDGCAVLHSLPVIDEPEAIDPTPRLLQVLDGRAARLVYLSTTGVYGRTQVVDHQTPTAPGSARLKLRVEAERAVAGAGCSWLVLRPAAIYGPWRGVHASMREGRFALSGDGSSYTSRIHLDDLAAHTVAGLRSDVSGSFPVADMEPCPSIDVARFCADLMDLPMPQTVSTEQLSETRRSNRKVNGERIRSLLGLELRYPSYREGIISALHEERRANPLSNGGFTLRQHFQH